MESLQLSSNILVTPAVSYPSHATGLTATNLTIRQNEAMENRTPLLIFPAHSSSCDTGLSARFVQTPKKKKFLTEFPNFMSSE